ncbi:MAG: hypothetical protein II628_12080 [Lachnospiraceae bacterium]|nr:hypothetical protein [Lachnospiraceae bacterium]
MAEKKSFRTDSSQTKEEFLAQFEEAGEDITVKVTWAWEKGCSKFSSFGKEDLVHIRFGQPWEADESHPFGTDGNIYWFSKRKLIGYPYSPRFERGVCYSLRVRRCREGGNNFLLEEVLEKKVDVSSDEKIYRKVLDRFRGRFEAGPREVLICCAHDADVRKAERADGMAIGYAYVDYSAVIDTPGGEPKMVGRCMAVPFSDRDFAENRSLKFKAGTVYRVLALQDKNNPSAMVLDRLLESGIRDEALERAGKEALERAVWTVEGFGDFDIVWDKISMKAYNENIRPDPAAEGSGVSVYLQCDPDNCHRAVRATEAFLRFQADRESLERQIFQAVADDLSDQDGMVETWDDETGTITREELIKRLSLELLSFEDGGIDILVGLDDLFTDHAYSLWMNEDGSITVNGLWG